MSKLGPKQLWGSIRVGHKEWVNTVDRFQSSDLFDFAIHISFCITLKKSTVRYEILESQINQNFGTVCHTKVYLTFSRLGAKLSGSIEKFLVWPQWWSFVDGSQQGLDFNKKISKMKIIFWFDFHRRSQGSLKSA